MKKFLILITMCMMSTVLFAQEKDVTKFMGIPVDGTLLNFADALVDRGFKQARGGDESVWKGEFNGDQCRIYIATTHNQVSRIVVCPQITWDIANLRIAFNTLCNQFANNPKYYSLGEYTIPDNEDISYEMGVKNRRYEAIFYQKSYDLEHTLKKSVWFAIYNYQGKYGIALYYDNEYNRPSGEDL